MSYIVENIKRINDPQILFSIWKESFTDLDMRRIFWSYEQNPYGRARLWLLKDQSTQQYIGMCSVFPRMFKYNGKSLKGGITADFALKKQYRSLGPALKLTKAILNSDEFDILFGMPNEKSVSVQLRAGFKELGKTSRFIKFFHARKILKSYFNHLFFWGWPIAEIFLKLKMIPLKLKTNRYCKIDNTYDYSIDSFCNRLYSMLPFFSGQRDGRYLRYRFEKNPYQKHQIFKLFESDWKHLRGYIIFHVKDNVAKIDDFFAKDLSDSLKELLDSFSRYCIKNKYDAMYLQIISNSYLDGILKKFDFFQIKSEQHVLYHTQINGIVEQTDFFLTSGDFDW